jgi:hypothetical protein
MLVHVVRNVRISSFLLKQEKEVRKEGRKKEIVTM